MRVWAKKVVAIRPKQGYKCFLPPWMTLEAAECCASLASKIETFIVQLLSGNFVTRIVRNLSRTLSDTLPVEYQSQKDQLRLGSGYVSLALTRVLATAQKTLILRWKFRFIVNKNIFSVTWVTKNSVNGSNENGQCLPWTVYSTFYLLHCSFFLKKINNKKQMEFHCSEAPNVKPVSSYYSGAVTFGNNVSRKNCVS